MSYDIYLVDPVSRETLLMSDPHHMRGGTYCVGGSHEMHLNCTYNYAKHYHRVFNNRLWRDEYDGPRDDVQPIVAGVRTIYGLSGAESLAALDAAIAQLGDDVDPDYWQPTEGNCKRALLQLRALATMRPDGVWAGD